VTTGNVIALVFAVLFAILVALIAIPLVKLGKLLDEAGRVVHNVGDSTLPLIGEVTTSVQHVNTSLESVETVTDHAKTIAGNASTLSGLFAATLGGPLVKVAAFSFGVRRAIGDRRSADIAKRVKDEMKAERKARRGKGA
jgi:predicted PurR-regulated permease PerM